MRPKTVVLASTSSAVLHLGSSLGPSCKDSMRKRGHGVRVLSGSPRPLGLMAEGRSKQAICDALFLTPKTVESHVGSIFTKLDLAPG